MKKSKILSLLLCITVVLSCMAFAPATTIKSKAATATANTQAIHIGKSTKYDNVPSAVFFNLVQEGKYVDGTTATFTAKVKMLSGEMPKVTMFRTNSGKMTLETHPESTWVSSTSYDSSTGIFTANLVFKDIPGITNCWYYDYFTDENGTTSYKRVNASSDVEGVWGSLAIGNCQFNNTTYGSGDTFEEDFIMTEPKLIINDPDCGNTNYAPGVEALREGSVYSLVGPTNNGTRTDARNNPLELGSQKNWGILSTDIGTVQKVTVDNDFLTSNRSYVKHDETANTYEYYTCSDFGEDVKFEKIEGSNCYNKIDNANKKSFVIRSHNDNDAYSNIFVPLNVHKWFSAYDASGFGCTNTNLREDDVNFYVDITFNAKRISGTGSPIIGKMYGNKYNAWGGSGTTVRSSYDDTTTTIEPHDSYLGAPRPSTKRVYNIGDKTTTDNQDGVTQATYNPETGDFSARIRIEKANYRQMSRHGISTYITIGMAEHNDTKGSYDAFSNESSFVISDIKFKVYADKANAVAGTPMFGGANQAPKMTSSNIDTTSRYLYFAYSDNPEVADIDGSIAMNTAPIDKYSVEGAVQNVTTIDKNDCNAECHTLTHNNGTDTTFENYYCSTCKKYYSDAYASQPLTTTAKKLLFVDKTDSDASVSIPLDIDGWTGSKTFTFSCKMQVLGNGTPKLSMKTVDLEGSLIDGSQITYNYNPSTCTYSATFTIDRKNPAGNDYFKYYSLSNGMHTALTLSNSTDSGKVSFVISDPIITDSNNKQFNLQLNDITSNDNLLTAPVEKWNKQDNGNAISYIEQQNDIFTNTYFSNRMLCLSGTTTDQQALYQELALEQGCRYKFDIDYREFGGAKALYTPQLRFNNNGYNYIGSGDYTGITPTDTGTHYQAYIDVWDNARSDNNFKLYIGERYILNNSGSVYFANISLYKIDKSSGAIISGNLIENGSFNNGLSGKVLANSNLLATNGWTTKSIFDLPYSAIEKIPTGFFSDDSAKNYEKVYEFKGSDTYKPQFSFNIYGNSTYKLTYDYYCADDCTVNAYLNNYYRQTVNQLTITRDSRFNKTDGKFQASYTITNTSSADDGSGTISFALNGNSYNKSFRISNIRIYLTKNGQPVGTNLALDLNTFLDDSAYGVTSTVGSEKAFDLGTSTETALRKNVTGIMRWIGNTTKGSAYSKVVKTDGNLFKYYTVDERFEFARKAVLLGESNIVTNSSSRFYDPNGDKTIDIVDMVRLETDSKNNTDRQFAVANDDQ